MGCNAIKKLLDAWLRFPWINPGQYFRTLRIFWDEKKTCRICNSSSNPTSNICPPWSTAILQLPPHQIWPNSHWTFLYDSWGNLTNENFKGDRGHFWVTPPIGGSRIPFPGLYWPRGYLEGVVLSLGIFKFRYRYIVSTSSGNRYKPEDFLKNNT